MDEQRLFLLTSLQQARKWQFDGPPFEPWALPGAHSLPPVPDKPKKTVKPASLAKGPMRNRPNMERVITAAGRQKWVLAPAIVEEVRARITAGQTTKTIAQAMSLPIGSVNKIGCNLRKEKFAMPVQQYQEAPRTFVIDWKSRLAAIEFSSPPAGCLPKKGHKRVCAMTRGQMGESLRAHGVTAPLAINCVAPGQPVRASTEKPVKPAKTCQKSKLFAGEKDVDLELHWRKACTI